MLGNHEDDDKYIDEHIKYGQVNGHFPFSFTVLIASNSWIQFVIMWKGYIWNIW